MIYADYNASAPLSSEVKKFLLDRVQSDIFANPNSMHFLGRKISSNIENSRKIIAKEIGANTNQVSFNSGATESISHVIHSELKSALTNLKKRKVLTSEIEHSAVYSNIQKHFTDGFSIIKVKTLKSGLIDLEHFTKIMKDENESIALVSIMAANNETGVIQPFEDIAKICNKYYVAYLCDTTQFIGKHHFDFEKSSVSYAMTSGHKIGALTGVGFLLSKDPYKLVPLIAGESQEKGIRGGTQNYTGIESLAVAIKHFSNIKTDITKVSKLKLDFEDKLKKEIKDVIVFGDKSNRTAGSSYLSVPGIHGQALQLECELNEIYISTSSACSDNFPKTSHVLTAMGFGDIEGRGAIRISVGNDISNLEETYDIILRVLVKSIKKLKKIGSY